MGIGAAPATRFWHTHETEHYLNIGAPMAGATLLTPLDDITVLDDVAAMTQLAAKKTAGGPGRRLGTQRPASHRHPGRTGAAGHSRVAKGSALNKAILVPAAPLIQAFRPFRHVRLC